MELFLRICRASIRVGKGCGCCFQGLGAGFCLSPVICLVVFVIGAPAFAAPVVGPFKEALAGIDQGLLLISELNCAACHELPGRLAGQISSRLSPILGTQGPRLTPDFIKRFIVDPQGTKPGTTMPDMLTAVPVEERASTAESLTHFLMWAQGTERDAEVSVNPHKMELGRRLYHQAGCAACHAPMEPASAFSSVNGNNEPPGVQQSVLKTLAQSSIPLSDMASKMTVTALTRFLLNPLDSRPSGRMPSMNLTEGEASAIAMYLARDQAKAGGDGTPAKQLPGLHYEYFEEDMSNVKSDLDAFSPKASGDIEGFVIKNNLRVPNIGFAFSGFIKIPASGRYTFHVRSDDGSKLSIGGKLVVDNWGDHAPQEISKEVELAEGNHPVQLLYYNNGAGADLAVAWEGPGISRQDIPASALFHIGRPMRPTGPQNFSLDPSKISEGRRKFTELKCHACHLIKTKDPADGVVIASGGAKPFDKLVASDQSGCVRRANSSKAPDFRFSDAQRVLVSDALARMRSGGVLAEAKPRAAHRLASFNCYACHSRDGIGGPDPQRTDYFGVTGEVDLGDEGRLPPHLTTVGAKLRGAWLREVLFERGAVRPYMATRMPQFGRSNIETVASDLQAADLGARSDEEGQIADKDAKWGRKLVGRDGLTCIACHTFASYKSLGVPAMDLTQMAKRLRKSWFEKYLVDPAGLRPGTRMPSFWPDGKAANREILGGDGPRQINAIWAFLSKGRDADIPEGLIQGKQELVPQTEPLIYRNFIAGAGSRAIAVGYPEKAHLAFDANEIRMALMWHGAFLDAARHRTDRGVGFEPPLGNDVLKFPEGRSFAILGPDMPEWPKQFGANAGQHFLGYTLDAQRRITFRYAVGSVEVEDQPVPKIGEVDPYFVRKLALRSTLPPAGLWFRAARADRIERQDNGWLIDGRWTVQIASGARPPLVRSSAGKQELLVPVEWQGDRSQIVEEITW